ncbi:MAG: tRNA pseudouridine(38-40) synthase TruA [Tannerella sp.]|jgi:tRNA pseudouridine38-40 synthase|nr:tRNA pseudouridine(38-40) synthase TruA [Tannerella sp.]
MYRYFIYMSYSGAAYCGWQNQPNGTSVQQRLEEALATILRRPTPVTGAGRTDTGVHARLMVAHMDAEMPPDEVPFLAEKLNRLLPHDIAVSRIVSVRPDAHARFDALARTYRYTVTGVKSPFNHEWVCRMSLRGMDFAQMNEACRVLCRYTDFTSFSKLHTGVKTNNCRVDYAGWTQEGDLWVFTIRADRFLRNMVRAVVGTLFEVGRGRRSVDNFARLIEAKDRRQAGTSADAKGLALVDITYPDDIFI